MNKKKLSEKELYAIFENCGWFKGRKVDIDKQLPKGYRTLPESVYAFLQEFCGLKFEYGFEDVHDFLGETVHNHIDTHVVISPNIGYEGELDDTGHLYYSDAIGEKLYPVGMKDHSDVALDEDLNMYILEMGFGCMRISDNPIDGLRKILENNLYDGVYKIVEVEDDVWEWFKRE